MLAVQPRVRGRVRRGRGCTSYFEITDRPGTLPVNHIAWVLRVDTRPPVAVQPNNDGQGGLTRLACQLQPNTAAPTPSCDNCTLTQKSSTDSWLAAARGGGRRSGASSWGRGIDGPTSKRRRRTARRQKDKNNLPTTLSTTNHSITTGCGVATPPVYYSRFFLPIDGANRLGS